MPSKAQSLNDVARQQLSEGGLDAVKKAMQDILVRNIDTRGGHEWDCFAESDPDYFVRLEVVAEWLDDDNAEVAKWRQQRLEQYGA